MLTTEGLPNYEETAVNRAFLHVDTARRVVRLACTELDGGRVEMATRWQGGLSRNLAELRVAVEGIVAQNNVPEAAGIIPGGTA